MPQYNLVNRCNHDLTKWDLMKLGRYGGGRGYFAEEVGLLLGNRGGVFFFGY